MQSNKQNNVRYENFAELKFSDNFMRNAMKPTKIAQFFLSMSCFICIMIVNVMMCLDLFYAFMLKKKNVKSISTQKRKKVKANCNVDRILTLKALSGFKYLGICIQLLNFFQDLENFSWFANFITEEISTLNLLWYLVFPLTLLKRLLSTTFYGGGILTLWGCLQHLNNNHTLTILKLFYSAGNGILFCF